MNNHMIDIITKVWKKNCIKCILMIIAIIGSITVSLVPPLLLEYMVNQLSEGREILFLVAISYLLIFAISGIFESLQNVMITMTGQAITHEIRSAMSQKLEYLSTDYFTKNEKGKITSRFVNDVDAVDSLFTNGIISMFADAFKIISIMIVIFIKSKGLGIILCLVAPILFVMTYVFQKRMRKAQIRNREAIARVNHHVPETIQNIRMIHNNTCEEYMERQYDVYIEEGYRAMDQSNFYDSLYSPIVIFISSLMIAIMMICASAGTGMQQLFGISIGSAVAIIAYVGKVFDPMESIGMEIQNIQSALAGIVRINEFLNEDIQHPQFMQMKEEIQNIQKDKLTYQKNDIENERKDLISFKHVKFDYGNGKDVFIDETFSIKHGESVVFTGRTGAGKSTLFKLLLGLYEPKEGFVLIKGIPSTVIKAKDRRKLFGYVEQHFVIVDGTIGDQVSLFDTNISEKDVIDALQQCGLLDKVESMPRGLDTPMNMNDFSQGELQLLNIARALVAKPEIMLLDEMTANLDSITEQRILEIIRHVAEGRTVLSISHRMAEKLDGIRVIEV